MAGDLTRWLAEQRTTMTIATAIEYLEDAGCELDPILCAGGECPEQLRGIGGLADRMAVSFFDVTGTRVTGSLLDMVADRLPCLPTRDRASRFLARVDRPHVRPEWLEDDP